MKKIILFAVSLLPAAVCAQEIQFVIKGKIGNLDAPAKIYFSRWSGNSSSKSIMVDSAVLRKGLFEFKATAPYPHLATLTLLQNPPTRGERISNPDYLKLYVENGTIMISAKDSLKNASIKGSPLNKLDQELQSKLKGISVEKQKQIRLKFIKENPNSFVSLTELRNLTDRFPDPTEVEPIFNSLSPEIRNSEQGKRYAMIVKIDNPTTAIGQIAPVFEQNGPDGKPVKLEDFRGKYVLLDFWASWCGPCRVENPNLVKAYKKYKDKNFTILSVSLDKDGQAWLNAIEKDKLSWTHVSDLKYWENAVAKQYNIGSIPQNFLIDPQGRIVAKNLQGSRLDKKLAEQLMNSGQ